MFIEAEFTVYPFEQGDEPPPHVQAAIRALREADLEVEVGPLSQVVRGEADIVLEALRTAQMDAVSAGATRIVVSIQTS